MVKRTPLFITLGLVLLLAGGITFYQYIIRKDEISVWDIIPSQTVLVYEFDDCKECNSKETPITKILEKIQLDFPDSTRKTLEVLSSPKKGKSISLHITSKDDFDFIYYFSAAPAKEFENLINSWKGNSVKRFAERELNGIKINEFTIHGKLFSCTQLGEIWIGSFTPFLIEDVIRTFRASEKSVFSNEIAEISPLPRIKGDLGNFYVHLPNLVKWLGVFTEKNYTPISLGKASLLDIKLDESSLTLNGFSLAGSDQKSTLSIFANQSPVQFVQKQYISNRCVFAVNLGVSSGGEFYKSLDLSRNKNFQDSLSTLTKINFQGLFESFGKELSLCYLESRSSLLSKIILFETSKPQEWLDALDQLSKAAEKEDTVFYERYSTYEIREIELGNLPGKLFSPLISGFDQTYYTVIGNTIILSEQLEEIKQFADDIDQENVWGKSVSFNKFLESTLLESNLSIYVNSPLMWSILSKRLSPRWQKFISQNRSVLNSLDMGAIQFSHLNESFYTNIAWTYSSQTKQTDVQGSRKLERLTTNLNSSIISKPFVVRSHVSKDDEILIQDSLFNLHYLSSQGKVLWSVPLDGPIVDDIQQIDFFANGKLQFFFVASQKIHVIDRLGKYVPTFPAEIKIKDLEFVDVIDYDNSKRYRFLVADKSGKLWMFDKDIQSLEGWRPRNIQNGLFTTAQHHRIRGKDYILGITKDGKAHLMNRRGEYVKGFPLNLDARLDGDYFVEVGNSAASTSFVCVSRDGFRIKFNLEGKILSRETLVKPSFDTQFCLIAEEQRKSYVMKRQDAKRLSILNEEGNEILTNDFVGLDQVRIQFYDFGAGKIYLTITDLVQDVSFVYDGKGTLLTQTPIEGASLELRPSRSDMPKMFIVDQNAVIIQ